MKILLLVLLLICPVVATDNQNVALHEIGSADGVHVFKLIHYGCEIFVATSSNGNVGGSITGSYPTPIAITTGRGCR